MHKDVFIGVGANIDADRNIPKALAALLPRIKVTGISIFYRSDPLAHSSQAAFTNGVFRICWDGTADDLKFSLLRGIEFTLGRRRTADRCADRPIDLDILLFGQELINMPGVTIPDPEIAQRPFIYIPLLELAPDVCLPGNVRLLQQVPGSLIPSGSGLKPAVALTEKLRAIWMERGLRAKPASARVLHKNSSPNRGKRCRPGFDRRKQAG